MFPAMVRLAVLVLLVGCWRGPSQPVPAKPSPPATASAPAPAEPSYRAITIAVDASGLAMIAGGMLLYRVRGLESTGGHVLVASGGLTAALGTPLVHLTHGRGPRGLASYGIRAGMATMGMLAGMSLGCADKQEFLCELTPNLWWGIAGGLAVASTLDALLLHSSDSTWAPTVIPTEGGAQVGLAKPW
jgi:hypothetical protein